MLLASSVIQAGFLQHNRWRWSLGWTGTAFERIPFLQVPEVARKEENLFSCVLGAKREKLSMKEKESAWCPPRGEKGELGNTWIFQLFDFARLYGGGGKLAGDLKLHPRFVSFLTRLNRTENGRGVF